MNNSVVLNDIHEAPEKDPRDKQFLYVMIADNAQDTARSYEHVVIKVGVTENVPLRRRVLNTGSAFPIRIVSANRGYSQYERKLHLAMKQWHMSGEWFAVPSWVFAYIESCGVPDYEAIAAACGSGGE